MKILDDGRRKISWSYHAVRLSIDEPGNRDSYRRNGALFSKFPDYRCQLRDQFFGSNLINYRGDRHPIIVHEGSTYMNAGYVNANEICSWSGHGNKSGLGGRSCVDEE